MADKSSRRTSVLLVGIDGTGLRGIELVLAAHDLRVMATAGDAEAARRGSGAADVVLLDLSLHEEAMRVVTALREAAPRLRILGYGDRRPWPIQPLLDAGMRGFVLSVSDPITFVGAVRAVAAGATFLDPSFAIADRDDPLRESRAVLTERERQIIGLLAHGLTGTEIAGRLFLSPATVRTHVQNAMNKLGARTRAQAIAIATGRPAEQLAS